GTLDGDDAEDCCFARRPMSFARVQKQSHNLALALWTWTRMERRCRKCRSFRKTKRELVPNLRGQASEGCSTRKSQAARRVSWRPIVIIEVPGCTKAAAVEMR